MAKQVSKRRGNNEGSIRLRADGKTWEGQYSCENKYGEKVRRSVYGKSKKEVTGKLTKALADAIRGDLLDPSSLTVEQWADEWLENHLINARNSTRYQYAQQLRLYVHPLIGSTQIQKVTPMMIQKIISKMLSTNKSPKTCRNVHGILHHLFHDAVANQLLKLNPAEYTKLPKVEKKDMMVLSEEKYQAFIQEIVGKPFENVFYLAAFSGMREGEILGLTWNCVDFDRKRIIIKQQLKRDSKIGEKNSQYVLSETKTGNHRTLVLDETVFDHLRAEKANQAKNKLRLGADFSNNSNLVFTDACGHYINGRTLLKAFKKRVEAIGIPEMRFHDLRHSFATQSFKNGDSVIEVQKNLGHTQASTTLNVYAHCTEEMQIDSANRMSAFIQTLKKGQNAV